MSDEQILSIVRSIGALEAGQRDLSAWVGKLEERIDASAESVRTEMRQLRDSVELLGTKLVQNGRSYSIPESPQKPPEPGELSKEDRGFWLAVGKVWNYLPAPARWAIVAAFLVGLIVIAPTLLRVLPGAAKQTSTIVSADRPSSGPHRFRATPSE